MSVSNKINRLDKYSFIIILGFILHAIVVSFLGKIWGQNVWNVITSASTLGIFGVAIFFPFYQQWRKRPILETGFFEIVAPHLRKTDAYSKATGEKIEGVYIYPLSISLKNTGDTIAKSAQPHLTGSGPIQDGIWKRHEPWIPAPMEWGLDELAQQPTEEKDLVPNRNYVFNFLSLLSNQQNTFKIETLLMAGGQDNQHSQGEYYFELTVTAEGAKALKKYIYVNWKGSSSQHFEDFQKSIKIEMKHSKPK